MNGSQATQARARVWTPCLVALALAALAVALVGASVALAALLIVAVLRAARLHPDGHR